MQESGYSLKAKNSKSSDFGLSQINHRNIVKMGLDKERLMNDLDYAVDVGAKILASYKRFAKREPASWWSRYNCGVRPLHVVGEICQDYKSKVERYL